MNKDERDILIIAGIVLFALLSCIYYVESIEKEETIMITQITKYPNRIFIYSYETSIAFTRFPYGHSLDQLRVIEVGKTYRINYTGYKIFSVEEVN